MTLARKLVSLSHPSSPGSLLALRSRSGIVLRTSPRGSKFYSSSPSNTTPLRSQKDEGKSGAASAPTVGAQTEQKAETKPTLTIEEQDALAFRLLDDREGSGAGNEIVDGQYEKGMTKHTRANQFRVI